MSTSQGTLPNVSASITNIEAPSEVGDRERFSMGVEVEISVQGGDRQAGYPFNQRYAVEADGIGTKTFELTFQEPSSKSKTLSFSHRGPESGRVRVWKLMKGFTGETGLTPDALNQGFRGRTAEGWEQITSRQYRVIESEERSGMKTVEAEGMDRPGSIPQEAASRIRQPLRRLRTKTIGAPDIIGSIERSVRGAPIRVDGETQRAERSRIGEAIPLPSPRSILRPDESGDDSPAEVEVTQTPVQEDASQTSQQDSTPVTSAVVVSVAPDQISPQVNQGIKEGHLTVADGRAIANIVPDVTVDDIRRTIAKLSIPGSDTQTGRNSFVMFLRGNMSVDRMRKRMIAASGRPIPRLITSGAINVSEAREIIDLREDIGTSTS
jgi:hypothetical protein